MVNQSNKNTTSKEDFVHMRKERIAKESSTVSSVLRQFILAGIGIVWLFRVTKTDGSISLDANLMVSLKCFVVAIFSEFIHYLIEIVVNFIHLCGSLRTQNMPVWYSFIPWILWVIKIVLVLVAYIQIGCFLFGR